MMQLYLLRNTYNENPDHPVSTFSCYLPLIVSKYPSQHPVLVVSYNERGSFAYTPNNGQNINSIVE